MTPEEKTRLWRLLPPELRREVRLHRAFLTAMIAAPGNLPPDRYRAMRLQLDLLFGSDNILAPDPESPL